MKMMHIFTLFGAVAVMAVTAAEAAVSDPAVVYFSPSLNRNWTTVCTNAVSLPLDWPQGADHAELEIAGMGGTFTTNITVGTAEVLWQAFPGDVPAYEDVYTLALRFYTAGNALAGEQSARLAVVAGAFGCAAVDPGPSDKNWTKVRGDAVIPYDATWAGAAEAGGSLAIEKIGGASQTDYFGDASGYYGWKFAHSAWGYGAFHLTLAFPGGGESWEATLNRLPGGTIINVK